MGLCSLPVVWPHGRGKDSKSNLIQKDLCQHVGPPRTVAERARPPGRSLSSHASARDSQAHTGKSGSVSCEVIAPFSWVLVNTRFCLCPPRVSASTVLWKFCNQILLTFKVRFVWDTQSLCQIPSLGSLLCDLELSQQCEKFRLSAEELMPLNCGV